MNGKVKWHKANGPAFNPGEIWLGSRGHRVEVVSVRKYPNALTNHCSEYGVTYKVAPDTNPEALHEKDAWNFQVRYTHQADLNLKEH